LRALASVASPAKNNVLSTGMASSCGA
jgi:hypothetical protein